MSAKLQCLGGPGYKSEAQGQGEDRDIDLEFIAILKAMWMKLTRERS